MTIVSAARSWCTNLVRWALIGGLSAIASAGLTGCQSAPSVPVSGTEVLERVATIGLDIENRRGSILVHVKPGLAAPRVIARSGTTTGAPSENYRGERWATAEIVATETGAVLRVRTAPRQENEPDWWTQIIVETPSADGVRIRNSDGVIDLRGVSGALDVVNGGAGTPGGPIWIECGRVIASSVNVQTQSGDIDLFLPSDSTGAIELISGDQRLATVAAWTGQLENSSHRPGIYRGVLNRGQNAINVRSGAGEVTLRVGPYRFGNPHRKYYKHWTFS